MSTFQYRLKGDFTTVHDDHLDDPLPPKGRAKVVLSMSFGFIDQKFHAFSDSEALRLAEDWIREKGYTEVENLRLVKHIPFNLDLESDSPSKSAPNINAPLCKNCGCVMGS